MHTRIYRGYLLGWGDPKDPDHTDIGTADGDWISSAADQDEAERFVDEWVDNAR